MSTADAILKYLNHGTDCPHTASEIAFAIAAKPSTVAAALRRMEAAGKVRKVGVAFSGGRTWTLTEEVNR